MQIPSNLKNQILQNVSFWSPLFLNESFGMDFTNLFLMLKYQFYKKDFTKYLILKPFITKWTFWNGFYQSNCDVKIPIFFRSLNGEYRSNTAERCRLRRSRTPVSARTPPPSAVFMSPSPSWSSTLPSSTNTTRSVNVRNGTDNVDASSGTSSPIYRCSEDGTLRIPIRSTTAKPKTTSGYYTTNNKQFLWFSIIQTYYMLP